jgi:hypothetical protein
MSRRTRCANGACVQFMLERRDLEEAASSEMVVRTLPATTMTLTTASLEERRRTWGLRDHLSFVRVAEDSDGAWRWRTEAPLSGAISAVGAVESQKLTGPAASSLGAVPDPCCGIRESPARVVEFRVGSAPPFECNPAASGPCAPPEGFCEGCQRIAARVTFGRQFESRQLQFHDTAFSKASGSLIGVQPKIQQLLSDGCACPEYVRFEQ